MTTTMWYCIAFVLLASVRGQLYDNDSQSYYEKPESSSPAPLSSPTSSQQEEAKDIVLYLTPNQAQALKAAGAVVKPLPEFEKTLSQQNYQQNLEEQTRLLYQSDSTEDSKKNNEQNDNYRLSNVASIKEDSRQPTEQITEKPLSKYKYTYKGRPQEYSTLYTAKKLNKDKTYSTEYIRYLPSYEVENLKLERYNTQPLPGYRSEEEKVNRKPQTYAQTETPELRQTEEIRNSEELRKVLADFARSFETEPKQAQQLENGNIPTSSITRDKGPVTFEGKPLQPAKVWESDSVRELSNIWKANKESEQFQTSLGIGTPLEISIRPNSQIEEKLSPVAPTPATIQGQFSSLLAPLIQHEKIVETIAEQKDLINNERAIHSKLQELKQSGFQNQEKYAAELDKLNKNLNKQNALAEKIALEAASKKFRSQSSAKPEFDFKRGRPEQIERNIGIAKPIPVLVQIPQSVELRQSSDNSRPASTSSVQAEKYKEEKSLGLRVQKPIPVHVIRDYYIRSDKPYTLNKGPSTDYKQEIPSSLSIIRHLWDH